MSSEKVQKSDREQQVLTETGSLVLFNDDFNTFEFVIRSLIDVCSHQPEQAEQCALITHYKGKCTVNYGSFYELKPQYDQLSLRGLTVEIN